MRQKPVKEEVHQSFIGLKKKLTYMYSGQEIKF